MKKSIFVISIVAGLLMTACQPETLYERLGIPEGALLLTSESFNGSNTKTSVLNETVQWENNDQVSLRGNTYSVTVSNGNAYIGSLNEGSGTIYGYYPANLKPYTWNQNSVYVNIPAEYESFFDGDRQVIQLPMMGSAAEEASTIGFKHLTAAILVRVKNTTGQDVFLDSVIVSSATQKLNGSTRFLHDSENFGVTAATTSTNRQKRVKVYFSDNPVIYNGGNDIKEVQVPILPINSGDITIGVYAHCQSAEAISITGVPSVLKVKSYNFSNSKNTSALARNQMCTAQIELKTTTPSSLVDASLFSVGASTKIRFSKGNLQYIGSDANPYWKFADNQYSVIDNNSQCSAATNIDRDLLGWGTSGYNNKYPYMVSTTASDYGNGSGVHIAGTNYDWGVYNAISNGGNEVNQWRTLTDAEWTYLFKTRTNAALKYGFGVVGGVNGIIILPDAFLDPSTNNGSSAFAPGNGTTPDWTDNIYSPENWTLMENAGAIFLPVAGRRNGTSYNSTYAVRGYYWSATASSSSAKYIYFYKSTGGTIKTNLNTSQTDGRYYGFSVRLVRDVQ